MARDTPPYLPDQWTEVDFDGLSWEESILFGFQMEFSNSVVDWTPLQSGQPPVVLDYVGGELALYVDFIVEPVPTGYWHVPVKLIFHGITDLKINFDYGDSGYQNAPSSCMIEGIERQLVTKQKVHLDRLYYSWAVRLLGPAQSSGFTFGAYGFTQSPSGKAVLTEAQYLPSS